VVQEKYTNRKIQSKRVLGLMKNTHWLADHKYVAVPDPLDLVCVYDFL
jgi:hypothetical protein